MLAARIAAKKLGGSVTPYKCPFGAHYHCGHKPFGKKTRRQNGHA